MAYSFYSPGNTTPRCNFEMVPSLEWKSSGLYNGLDPLIFHIQTDFDYDNIPDAIKGELQGIIPDEMIFQLIDFGAVYFRPAGTHKTKKPKRTTPEKSSLPLQKGSYVRVSANPKCYPHFWDVGDWKSLIIFESDDLLAVNKPAGCPTTETADNIVENVRKKLERTLGYNDGKRKLEVASRLDIGTEGLLLFAKTPRATSMLNSAFRNRTVTKKYRLRCRKKPSQLSGSVIHSWNIPERKNSMPVLLSSAGEKTKRQVELEILSCEQSRHVHPDTKEHMWLAEVELKTGLTHQIRLQFSALGAALNGDTRYSPVEGLLLDEGEEVEFGKVVESRVDLQCFSLEFQDGDLPSGAPTIFELPPPVWYE